MKRPTDTLFCSEKILSIYLALGVGGPKPSLKKEGYASYPTLLTPYCYRNTKQNNNRHQGPGRWIYSWRTMTPDGKSQCQLEAIRTNTIMGQTWGQLERLAQNRDAWRQLVGDLSQMGPQRPAAAGWRPVPDGTTAPGSSWLATCPRWDHSAWRQLVGDLSQMGPQRLAAAGWRPVPDGTTAPGGSWLATCPRWDHSAWRQLVGDLSQMGPQRLAAAGWRPVPDGTTGEDEMT
ncbi:hypothetical protein DPMN_018349 [Dreissena polymorpha]|uniref:Uncharacterized protein n=1 Tax=Dreissena polymorpha TaxID=45954 RepID=A0A9D4NJ68_DREPO|nr:hypothetical protein DPMN_018349 [Dreissena polymorpha]